MRLPKRRLNLIGPAIVLGMAFSAVVLGLASAVLPWRLTLAFVGLLVVLPILVARPRWLVVPLIALQMYWPSQPMADVATGLFFLRCSFLLLGEGRSRLFSYLKQPVLYPVYAVTLIAVIAFAAGATILGHDRKLIYGDSRVFFYWLWVPVLALLAPPSQPSRWIINQVLLVALVVSILAVVQGATGLALVGTGRVGQLETLGRVDADITRVQISGFVFVTFALFYSIAALLAPQTQGRWLFALFVPLLLAALVYNFGRALWVWSMIGAFVVACTMGWRAALRGNLFAGIVGGIVIALMLSFQPRLADSIGARIASIFGEGGNMSSLGWRKLENRLALKKLADTAYLGVGFGGEYRRAEPGVRAFENQTSYIHNGHLALLLKTSIFGYLAHVALFACLITQAWLLRRHPNTQPIAAATVAWGLTFIGQNVTQPEIMSAHGVTLLGALVMTLAILRARKGIAQSNRRTGPSSFGRVSRVSSALPV